jgi:hypothetical protein
MRYIMVFVVIILLIVLLSIFLYISKTESFYDLSTRKVIKLSKNEITANMIKARISGKIYWIDTNQIKDSEIRHETISEENKKKILYIQSTLSEVDDSTLEKWEDDFKRDTHIDQEIDLWVQCADLYSHLISGKNYSIPEKKEIFIIIQSYPYIDLNSLKRDANIRILSDCDIINIGEEINKCNLKKPVFSVTLTSDNK